MTQNFMLHCNKKAYEDTCIIIQFSKIAYKNIMKETANLLQDRGITGVYILLSVMFPLITMYYG